jgi:hypothetical protein
MIIIAITFTAAVCLYVSLKLLRGFLRKKEEQQEQAIRSLIARQVATGNHFESDTFWKENLEKKFGFCSFIILLFKMRREGLITVDEMQVSSVQEYILTNRVFNYKVAKP